MNKQEIIDYLMHTPYNTNLAVLKSMLGDGDWSELLAYVKQTPYNVNRQILNSLLDGAQNTLETIIDGTYNFSKISQDYDVYILYPEGTTGWGIFIENITPPNKLFVTLDDLQLELPLAKTEGDSDITSFVYGSSDESFEDYPIMLGIMQGTMPDSGEFATALLLYTPISGNSHYVKVEMPIGDEESGNSAIVGEAIVGEATVEAINNGGMR